MEFDRLIADRYSVRAYRPDPVENDKLLKILEAARLAPTAANRQPFQILVIHTEGRQEELRRIYRREWFLQAPMILCVCGLPAQAWIRPDSRGFLDVDAAIVMDHMILAAADAGLGTCWIANFDAEAAREILQLPEGVEPLLFTPLGYAADIPRAKERKPLSALVRYEHW